MVNKFTRLSLQGQSMGELSFSRTKNVGEKGTTKVAELSINRSLSKVLINPQPDFNFGQVFETPMKLVNGHVSAGKARNNTTGVRVATIGGELLSKSDNKQDDVPEKEFDSIFVSGKDKHAVAKVRSADAFDKQKLVLVSTTENPKIERGQAVQDDNGDTIINNYSLSFIEEGKPLDEDNEIRIMLTPENYEAVKPFLKYGAKLVPQNLKFAFVGNDVTDWAIYAESVIPRENDVKKSESVDVKEKSHK
ncbi:MULTISPECIES: hypothetical protein [Fructobacillus]|uniref:hypothetical protein n=1 Tax=Fructobacillus TaxID=559173 RepID=UPI00064DB006|nr:MULTISPECIES: hypothetical protein [Fructobacillus]KMK52965.1 hypothetical protein FEFB_13250 [Fructobacillus sp. EFB-N1]MCK8628036.1 hypothetical protein [Fructobacillus cardui]CAK1230606.1 hypothetical protein R53653_IHELHDKM_00715 [Fructobacillus cardui]CAK1254029.1 hypothetical protein R82265_HNDDMDAM_01470 [Fructobacillus cardui]